MNLISVYFYYQTGRQHTHVDTKTHAEYPTDVLSLTALKSLIGQKSEILSIIFKSCKALNKEYEIIFCLVHVCFEYF